MNLAFVHVERAVQSGFWVCDLECRPVQGTDRSAGMLSRVEFTERAGGRHLVVEYDGPSIRRVVWKSQTGSETPFTLGASHQLRKELEDVLGISPGKRRFSSSTGNSGRLTYPLGSPHRW
ncbi:hypothetical protein L3Y19_gp010 [Gordonia phage Neville]|uniref:Uncharacterized protein n=1 Tax=Gordonia phage Neville TaxID=2301693 RepID=A0A385DYI1_9CAUD|nr:hypothetical protein L3Y19_gp010 [Gordonia phage Neville]AXQ64491.1 hypothetical protein SEA_NEVILLE_10 [Gordonia phage Neville]